MPTNPISSNSSAQQLTQTPIQDPVVQKSTLPSNVEAELLSSQQAQLKEEKKFNFIKLLVYILAFLGLVFLASIANSNPSVKKLFTKLEPTETTKPETSGENNQINLNFNQGVNFATFSYTATPFTPSLDGKLVKLEEANNLKNFEEKGLTFSQEQEQKIGTNNFLIVENTDQFYSQNLDEYSSRSDDWTYLYGQIGGGKVPTNRAPENAVFISSDFLLHTYHRLLEKEFEYIEQLIFYPKLKQLTDDLLAKSIENYQTETDAANKESLARTAAYLAIAKSLLDPANEEALNTEVIADTKADILAASQAVLSSLENKIPGGFKEIILQELNDIYEASEVKKSWLYGDLLEQGKLQPLHDYTQYGPRSHYNKNSVLRAYFRTMMWYGRTGFITKSPELTRDAIWLAKLLAESSYFKNWQDIYEPTVFFVGKSDDLNVFNFQEILGDFSKPITAEMVSLVQEKSKEMAGPSIMSDAIFSMEMSTISKEELQESTRGFRLMGQRFTPDAFILSSLTQGAEAADSETGESLPSTPTALMVMDILDNPQASKHLETWIQANAPNSKQVLTKKIADLKSIYSQLNEKTWTQNIYFGWLYSIKSLAMNGTDLVKYPYFMHNESWKNKSLQTSLGSYAELKHDTLLYAKQSYAEMGAGEAVDELPVVPKGYVEPNIEFLDRLLALSKMTYEGLSSRGLLGDEASIFEWRNSTWINSLEFFKSVAVDQLENKIIADDTFEILRRQANDLDAVLAPLPGEMSTEAGARSALIADIHTDASKGQILYEATGIPDYIYVLVSDANGTRLTKGLSYSYFEFTGNLGERLTDQIWREKNYTDDKSALPIRPNWIP